MKESDENKLKQKKQPKQLVFKNPPYDMRCSYGNMLADVFNANDIAVFENFFSNYGNRNTSLTLFCLTKQALKLVGRPNMLQYFFNLIQMDTANLMRVVNVKLHTLPNKFSKVCFQYSYSSVNYLALPHVIADEILRQMKQHEEQTHKKTPKRKYSDLDSPGNELSLRTYDTTVVHHLSRAPLLPVPEEVTVTGTTTMYLNQRHEITQMVTIMQNAKSRPYHVF